MRRVVFLGDSVTAGWEFCGVDTQNCYVARLRSSLRVAELGVEFIVSALAGVDTRYALKRFDRMVARRAPDLVVVMLGLNDARPPVDRAPIAPDTYRANLAQIAQMIGELGARPMLVTPTPRLERLDGGKRNIMGPYVAACRSVAWDYHLRCVDVHAAFCAQTDVESLLPDDVHPSPRGHVLIASVLHEPLAEVLNVAPSLRLSAPVFVA